MNGLIVIPVYNEEKNLSSIVAALLKAFPTRHLLFINDGSIDNSERILSKYKVKRIKHDQNLGYTQALKTGMKYVLGTTYEYVVFFDADRQHSVQDLKKIIKAYSKSQYDIIIGNRYAQNTKYCISLRFIISQVFSFITACFIGKKIGDTTCGLKLISRSFIPLTLILPLADMHAEWLIGASKNNARILEVPINVKPRIYGRSMHTSWRAVIYPIKTISCIVLVVLRNYYRELTGSIKDVENT